jgi:signal transduction histidine kinase
LILVASEQTMKQMQMHERAQFALGPAFEHSSDEPWDIDEPGCAAETTAQGVEQCPGVLLTTDLELRITLAQGLGLSAMETAPHELVNRPLQQFFRGAESFPVDIYRRALAGQVNSWECVWKTRTFYGQVRPLFDGQGNLTGTITTAMDITERKKKEESRLHEETQRQEANKVRSLKTLAGGVAHNFNNLLSAVMGYTSLALLEVPTDSPIGGILLEIDAAAQCAANLAGQMLVFAQKSRVERAAVNLSKLIGSHWPHLQISAGNGIVLLDDLAEDLPDITGDGNQLRNLIMTLVRNASDSIGDGSGTIQLRTQAIHGDGSIFPHMDVDLAEGDYVWLQVSDTGCGMDEETRARIFEPFFSTKFTGRGLGMAAAHGIVQSHGGAISVSSKPGLGSTIHVFLPAEQTSGCRTNEGHDSTNAKSPMWGQRLRPTDSYCGR